MNNKYKILLVEDEMNISNLVMTMLETSGYQVIQAKTCAMAKTLFISYCPDLVILDLGLPDMDGMTFLEDVRKDSLTPIIVLSARTNEKDKVLALDAGANDYVTKPFGAAELLRESVQPCAIIPTVQIRVNCLVESFLCRIWKFYMMPDRYLSKDRKLN